MLLSWNYLQMKSMLLKRLKIIPPVKCSGEFKPPLKVDYIIIRPIYIKLNYFLSDLGGVFGFFLGLTMINCAEYFLCTLPTKVVNFQHCAAVLLSTKWSKTNIALSIIR